MKIDGLNVNLAMKHNGGSGVPSSKVGISVTAGSVGARQRSGVVEAKSPTDFVTAYMKKITNFVCWINVLCI